MRAVNKDIKSKRKSCRQSFFLMFYQIFLSPQVKGCAIITYKHGIYELPHELRKDLRLILLFIYLFIYLFVFPVVVTLSITYTEKLHCRCNITS